MKIHRWLCILSIVSIPVLRAEDVSDKQDVLLVVSAAGTEDFAEGFTKAADAWRKASAKAGATFSVIGLDVSEEGGVEDRELFKQALDHINAGGTRPVWIVYLGHGTFNRREARLNLRGTDVTETELAQWLERFERPLVFVHGGSASGTFINKLSGPNRIIVTATQSGAEVNYARFGEYFAYSIGSKTADIDQDEQTSILDAFISAAQQTRNFYDEAGRMMTEHALIDDNGDQRGTPADWYRGTRAAKKSEDGSPVDGIRANRIALVENDTERQLTAGQRALRDEVESELEELRARKSSMLESNYLDALEQLFRRLAPIYVPDVEVRPTTDAEKEADLVPADS